jgi:hypothetical protein
MIYSGQFGLRRIRPSRAEQPEGSGDGSYYHFQRPVMINRTIQQINQGNPIKISAPGIIIKTLVSLVANQEIAATIGMIPMISTQQRMVIRRNIS